MTQFPYKEFRRGQRELAEEVAKCIKESCVLVVKAPTGFGKTAAVIYGLLLSEASKVLWVVRTINELDPVIRELTRFGAEFTFLFSARKMCPLMGSRSPNLSPEDFWANCRLARARGVCEYYERLRGISREELRRLTRSLLGLHAVSIARRLARDPGICPFFALRGLIGDTSFIVATYPYLFRPDIFNFVLEPLRYEDLVIVIDEAHSLLNAHTLLEQRIGPSDLERAIKEVITYMPEAKTVRESLERVGAELRRDLRRAVRRAIKLDKSRYVEALGDVELLVDAAEYVREKRAEEALKQAGAVGLGAVSSSLGKVASWASVLVMDESSLFLEPGASEPQLVTMPLDPAIVARKPIESSRACIMMSGTIPPGDFVNGVLGVSRHASVFDVELLFGLRHPRHRFMVVVDSSVTTRYVERSRAMYRMLAERIAVIASGLKGVKLAVYPSYEVLESVTSMLPDDIRVISETKTTSLAEVEEAIIEGGDYLINAVAGGKLVEGVEFTDYEGRNLLSVVIVVGIPFPQPDDYTRSYLEALASRLGYSRARYYAYLVSAIIKVKQAMGRAVRSPDDKAALFLLDYRFLRRDVRELMSMRYNIVVNGVTGLRNAVNAVREYLQAEAASSASSSMS